MQEAEQWGHVWGWGWDADSTEQQKWLEDVFCEGLPESEPPALELRSDTEVLPRKAAGLFPTRVRNAPPSPTHTLAVFQGS